MYPGMRRRTVYLPAGATWKNAETGASHSGGQAVDVETPLDNIPVFSGTLPPLPSDAVSGPWIPIEQIMGSSIARVIGGHPEARDKVIGRADSRTHPIARR